MGLFHGDVKPDNILFDENASAKLVDFGIASRSSQGKSDELWGTPYYIAPEKVQKKMNSARSDIYSLGATLYHAIQHPGAKRVFRIFDHCAIYLVIAGSYAPFALVTLDGRGGLRLAVIVWAIAIVGIVAECFLRERQPKWLSVLIYLALGWMVAFHMADIVELLPPAAFGLLLAGGLCYTLGCGFYLAKKVPYLHFVWHMFVLAGATCITLSALLFIV